MTDIAEVMAMALAEKQLARDQARAVQGGCDIMLSIHGYLANAREDVSAVLAALEKEGWVVVPKEDGVYHPVRDAAVYDAALPQAARMAAEVAASKPSPLAAPAEDGK